MQNVEERLAMFVVSTGLLPLQQPHSTLTNHAVSRATVAVSCVFLPLLQAVCGGLCCASSGQLRPGASAAQQPATAPRPAAVCRGLADAPTELHDMQQLCLRVLQGRQGVCVCVSFAGSQALGGTAGCTELSWQLASCGLLAPFVAGLVALLLFTFLWFQLLSVTVACFRATTTITTTTTTSILPAPVCLSHMLRRALRLSATHVAQSSAQHCSASPACARGGPVPTARSPRLG